ncbi:MAG TPA: DUF4232 domain-containing protein [Mycobacteriales bacterium]|nr:DUF4232 domain-containing protein [Mycobacteriales bacterium]
MTARARLASLALLALVAAACSSSSSGGDDTGPTSPATSSSPTASASVSPSASSSATPTPSFSSTVQATGPCRTKQLRLSLGQGQGAAGSTFVPIVLTNASKRACTLFGYPGVSFLDASGAQVGVDATHDGGEEATVSLAPGDAANAQLQLPDPGVIGADCKPASAATMQVYPPGAFSSLTVDFQQTVCTTAKGAANVHPVTPGAGG